MNVIGIICEYNPFHYGHKYQIDKIKEMYKDSIIIVVCSSCFTERGDVSVLTKWDKASVALNNGVDMFIELPFVFATQSSDVFAKGALKILNYLNIDTLIFGSECDNVLELKKLAETQLNDKTYNNIVKEYLDMGINYPTALSKALEGITKIKIDKPNDLLALSYIKEIIKNNYNITPVSIKRTNDYHGNDIKNNIVNASLIRTLLNDNKDISNYVPNYVTNYIKKVSLENFYPYLKYQIISNNKNLNKFQTVDEGIENRIIKSVYNSTNYNELIMNIKTKRYTYNKIQRMLLHILTNFTKEEASDLDIDYIRLLGFTKIGQQYLNSIKKTIDIPIITRYKPNVSKLLDIEFRITSIYALITNNHELIDLEYSAKPIIKK